VFATVLGLVAWIYLSVEVTVYAAEINVVLVRRLWPRGIIQPPLTEADRASIALQALQNQRREEQQVEVTFNDRPDGAEGAITTPRTPDEVTPPARRPSRRQRRLARARAARRARPGSATDGSATGGSASEGTSTSTATDGSATDGSATDGSAAGGTTTGGSTPAPAAHTSDRGLLFF